MTFKVFSQLTYHPLLVDLTIEEGSRLKVIYGSSYGFHAIDFDTSHQIDIYLPSQVFPLFFSFLLFIFLSFSLFLKLNDLIEPHAIIVLPNSNGMQLLLCYNNMNISLIRLIQIDLFLLR